MSSRVNCPPETTLKSSRYQGGPQVQQITFKNPNPSAYPIGDLWSGPLAFPATAIMLASTGPNEGSLQDSLYFHFSKIGRIYVPGSEIIVPVGNEPWIPIRETGYVTSVIDRNGWYIKFAEGREVYQQGFYIDFGAESTQTGDIVTFIYFDKSFDECFWPNRVGGTGGV
jgi:hypothetical protein